MNSFKFVGKIRPMKENGYEEHKFTSGWINRTLKFQMVCDRTLQYLQVRGGKWEDDCDNYVNTFVVDPTTKKTTPQRIEWDSRFDENTLKNVAGFKKFTIDTISRQTRDKLKESGDSDELKASYEKRLDFISAWDYAEALNEIITNDEYKEKKFVVTGTFDISFTDKDSGKYYRTFSVQKVYAANDDEEEGCFANVDAYFDEYSTADEDDENGDTPVKVYLQFYNSSDKKKYFAPMNLLIKNNQENAEGLRSLLTSYTGEVRCVSLLLNLTNKAQKTEVTTITEDQLTDEQKTLIEFGLTTLENIIKENTKSVYDEKKIENIIVNLANSNGAQQTDFDHDDLVAKPGGKKTDKFGLQTGFDDDDDDELPF